MPKSPRYPATLPLLTCALLLSCASAAHAAALSAADYATGKQRIAAQSRTEQAQCAQGATRPQCLKDAKARERDARSALETRQRPAAGAPRAGETAVRAGEYGHVARDGRITTGKAGDMPASSAAAARSAEQLRKQKLPSNEPVDVVKAARDAKGGKP
ncbi:MAG: hypothetical protein JWN73_1606 [Betaproteobacteria bacterium]|nr:hypothetical protein [Betaproteobacteria bacterium]